MQQTDEGWAWVILAATMGNNFLSGILCYFVGVLHTGLLDRFHSSVAATAWVGSLYSSNMCLTAPLAGMVINRYGCRVCCVLGGVLCFAGFTASAFVTSISMLFLTYGMLAGLGLGLCYSPTIITIGYYFDKFRGLASGLSVALAAVGILSGSLMAQAFINEYSVSGAFLLIGAVSLHYCLFGMFLRPTDYEGAVVSVSKDQQVAEDQEKRASRLSLALRGVEIRSVTSCSRLKDDGSSVSRPGYGSVTSLLRRAQLNTWRRHSLENLSSAASAAGSREIFSRNRKEDNSLPSLVRSVEIPQVLEPDGCGSAVADCCVSEERLDRSSISSRSLAVQCNSVCGERAVAKDDQIPVILISASNQNLPGWSGGVHGNADQNCGATSPLRRHMESTDVQPDHRTTSLKPNDVTTPNDDPASHRLLSTGQNTNSDDVNSVTSREVTKRLPKRIQSGSRNVKTKMLTVVDSYLAVVTNKPFMLHCFSVLAANIHISGVYLHLPEYAQSLGTSPTQAAALFVAVGLFSLLSRLVTGFATTEPKIDPLTLNMGMMGLLGLVTVFFPFFSATYGGQLAFSAFFGLYTGGQYALVNVLAVQFMGLSLLPSAFGVLVFLMGVGYVAGPPLAALLVDSGGTYQDGFFFLGSMMALGSFLDLAAGAISVSQEEENDFEVASVNRDWLGSSIVISIQETASAHDQLDIGSVVSVSSGHSQDLKV